MFKMKFDWYLSQSLNCLQKTMNIMTTIPDTIVLFIYQGEVKRHTDILAFMELTFGITGI